MNIAALTGSGAFLCAQSLAPWAGRALAGCVCRDVSLGLLSSPLCLGQERWRCEGTARSGSPRSSRSLLRRDHRGCRKSSASEAAAPLPRDGSDRRNSTYEAGGLLPSLGDSGCGRSRAPLPSPSAAPFTTWDPFQSVSLGTKEPGQFLHLKAADRGCCCSLRECWEANPWREVEFRKIIVVVIHLCLTSEHPVGLRCCHGTVALQFLDGFITYLPAGSGLCLPPWFCGFLAPLQIPEDQFAPGIPRAPGAAGFCNAQVAAPPGSTFSCCLMVGCATPDILRGLKEHSWRATSGNGLILFFLPAGFNHVWYHRAEHTCPWLPLQELYWE